MPKPPEKSKGECRLQCEPFRLCSWTAHQPAWESPGPRQHTVGDPSFTVTGCLHQAHPRMFTCSLSAHPPERGAMAPHTLPSSLPDAISALCLSSLLDDAVPSSTSESSALSRKRFTLQGLANLKGQKGKEAAPLPPSTPSSCGDHWCHMQPHKPISHPVIRAHQCCVDTNA